MFIELIVYQNLKKRRKKIISRNFRFRSVLLKFTEILVKFIGHLAGNSKPECGNFNPFLATKDIYHLLCKTRVHALMCHYWRYCLIKSCCMSSIAVIFLCLFVELLHSIWFVMLQTTFRFSFSWFLFNVRNQGNPFLYERCVVD